MWIRVRTTRVKVMSMNKLMRGSPRGLVANVLDCDIVVSEFEFQLRYYVHFWTNILEKGMKPFISSTVG